MRYVIDACNLLFSNRKLEELLDQQGFQAARAELVAMASKFAHAEKLDEVVLVFDGSEKGAHRPRQSREAAGRVILVFADPRASADKFIVEMVEDAKRPGEITVVSNDKFIIRNVTRAAGKHLSCGAFMRKFKQTLKHAADPLKGEYPRKYSNMELTPREMEEWMKYFGLDKE